MMTIVSDISRDFLRRLISVGSLGEQAGGDQGAKLMEVPRI